LNILTQGDLDAACQGVRYILHLAATDEIVSAVNPEEALLVNGLGTLKLLGAAERAGVERFIYFSTAHIYGSPLAGTITEKNLPRPVHPYAITHRVAEDFVLAAHDKKVLQGIVLRLSNGFGAPINTHFSRWTLVINDLCRQAVTSGKLVLRTSGLQWRDFITLTDVARAILHFLNLPIEQCNDGLFNLGGECSLRIIDIATLIAARAKEVFGLALPIHRPDPQPGEPYPSLDYCIAKLKTTDFTLVKNLDEEIDGTLRFCREMLAEKHA
jgi:UDP-glucose 4-epimerase